MIRCMPLHFCPMLPSKRLQIVVVLGVYQKTCKTIFCILNIYCFIHFLTHTTVKEKVNMRIFKPLGRGVNPSQTSNRQGVQIVHHYKVLSIPYIPPVEFLSLVDSFWNIQDVKSKTYKSS